MSEEFKYGGYVGKILRVNLTEGKSRSEPISEGFARNYIGGNGFGARILYDEVKPRIDPFSLKNKVVFMTGPVTGTIIPTAARIGVFTKSPLTGLFFDSYAGGHFGAELKYAGFDGIIVEGRAEKPAYLWIDDGNVEVRDASGIWGKTTFEAQKLVWEELGTEEPKIACIGPAGEKLVRVACTILGVRAAGRGGHGAVLGSKNLKAIAVRGSGSISVPDIEAVEVFANELIESIKANPGTGRSLPEYGTPGIVTTNNDLGILGTRNWQTEVFEGAENIGGEAMRKKIVVKSKACFACPINCTKYSVVRAGPYANTIDEGPEYETLFSLGSILGNDCVESVAKADRLCDEYGIDTISTGLIIGFAMECYENGILTKKDTGGLDLKFGNHEAVVKMVEAIGNREGLGDILAEGVKRAAEKIGRGSEKYAIHSKGCEIAGHSARGLPGNAIGYAAGTRGGSHHDSRPTAERTGKVDRKTIEGKGRFAKNINDMKSIMDSIILCQLTEVIVGLLDVTEMHQRCINVITGMNLSLADVKGAGERIWTLERAFNVREGVRRKDDWLPRRFVEEPIPEGVSKGMVIKQEDLNKMLDEYYEARGWDQKTGIPLKETLLKLDLNGVAKELYQ